MADVWITGLMGKLANGQVPVDNIQITLPSGKGVQTNNFWSPMGSRLGQGWAALSVVDDGKVTNPDAQIGVTAAKDNLGYSNIASGQSITGLVDSFSPTVDFGAYFATVAPRALRFSPVIMAGDPTEDQPDPTTSTPTPGSYSWDRSKQFVITAKEGLIAYNKGGTTLYNPFTSKQDGAVNTTTAIDWSDMSTEVQFQTADEKNQMNVYMTQGSPYVNLEFPASNAADLNINIAVPGLIDPTAKNATPQLTDVSAKMDPPFPGTGYAFSYPVSAQGNNDSAVYIIFNQPLPNAPALTAQRNGMFVVADSGTQIPAGTPQMAGEAFYINQDDPDHATYGLADSLPAGPEYQGTIECEPSINFTAPQGQNLVVRIVVVSNPNSPVNADPSALDQSAADYLILHNYDTIPVSSAFDVPSDAVYQYNYVSRSLANWPQETTNGPLLGLHPMDYNLSGSPSAVGTETPSMTPRGELKYAGALLSPSGAFGFTFNIPTAVSSFFLRGTNSSNQDAYGDLLMAPVNGVSAGDLGTLGKQLEQDITSTAPNASNHFNTVHVDTAGPLLLRHALTVLYTFKLGVDLQDSGLEGAAVNAAQTSGDLAQALIHWLSTGFVFDPDLGAIFAKSGYLFPVPNQSMENLTNSYGYFIAAFAALATVQSRAKIQNPLVDQMITPAGSSQSYAVRQAINGMIYTCGYTDDVPGERSRFRTYLATSGYSNGLGPVFTGPMGVGLMSSAEDQLYFLAAQIFTDVVPNEIGWFSSFAKVMAARQRMAAQTLWQLGSDPATKAGIDTSKLDPAKWGVVANAVFGTGFTTSGSLLNDLATQTGIYPVSGLNAMLDGSWLSKVLAMSQFAPATLAQNPNTVLTSIMSAVAVQDPNGAVGIYNAMVQKQTVFDLRTTPGIVLFNIMQNKILGTGGTSWTAPAGATGGLVAPSDNSFDANALAAIQSYLTPFKGGADADAAKIYASIDAMTAQSLPASTWDGWSAQFDGSSGSPHNVPGLKIGSDPTDPKYQAAIALSVATLTAPPQPTTSVGSGECGWHSEQPPLRADPQPGIDQGIDPAYDPFEEGQSGSCGCQ